MKAQCANCSQADVHLKICGRCGTEVYCSKNCQDKAWKEGHKMKCRPKFSASDDVPVEVRDKPWLHKYLLVKKFILDNACADPRNLRPLSTDETSVKDLYAKIQEYEANSKLTKAKRHSADSSSDRASHEQSRLSSSAVAHAFPVDALPPNACHALQDLCGAQSLLQTTSPHPEFLQESFSDVKERIGNAALQRRRICVTTMTLKHDLTSTVSKGPKLLVDHRDVGDKVRDIKAHQTAITFHEKKAIEYESKVGPNSKSRAEFQRSGYSNDITHEKILADVEALKEKLEETEELRGKVNAFHGLPANLDLAKVAVEEKRRDLHILTERVDNFMMK